jgi:hypothetical protein
MSPCFLHCAIFKSLGTIDDRLYFTSAIAHFDGLRHPGCLDAGLADNTLRAIDPVGSSFREMTVKTEFPPLHDIGMQYSVILST